MKKYGKERWVPAASQSYREQEVIASRYGDWMSFTWPSDCRNRAPGDYSTLGTQCFRLDYERMGPVHLTRAGLWDPTKLQSDNLYKMGSLTSEYKGEAEERNPSFLLGCFPIGIKHKMQRTSSPLTLIIPVD